MLFSASAKKEHYYYLENEILFTLINFCIIYKIPINITNKLQFWPNSASELYFEIIF
jgi:hypothetical protein